jgi:DNA-binding IscR family transcriptional regulator
MPSSIHNECEFQVIDYLKKQSAQRISVKEIDSSIKFPSAIVRQVLVQISKAGFIIPDGIGWYKINKRKIQTL